MSSDFLSARQPNPHIDPPLQSENKRILFIGLGAELVILALSIFVGGSFFPFLFACMGIMLIVYGIRPAWFVRHIAAQIIQGTPYRREVSIKAWLFGASICVVLSGMGSDIYHHYVPDKPNLLSSIVQTLSDIRKDVEPRDHLPASVQASSIHHTSKLQKSPPNAKPSEDPAVKEALGKQMTTLSSDLLDFAERRSKIEAQLPYLDPTVPEGQGKTKIPAARARDSCYEDTRKLFRYEGHYFQRCQRIVNSLPQGLRADNIASGDMDILERYCASDAQSWPQNSTELKNLSSLLLELSQEIQK